MVCTHAAMSTWYVELQVKVIYRIMSFLFGENHAGTLEAYWMPNLRLE